MIELLNDIYTNLPAFTIPMIIFWVLFIAWLFRKPNRNATHTSSKYNPSAFSGIGQILRARGLWGICVKRNTFKTDHEFTKRGEQ